MTAKLQKTPRGDDATGSFPSGRTAVVGTLARLARALPLTMLGVSLADIAVYEVAGLLDPEIAGWAGAGSAQIVVANAVYLTLGAAALLVLVRFAPRPGRWFAVLAALGVVGSLALPISAGLGEGSAAVPPAGLTTVITLSAMHVISYAIAVPVLLRVAAANRG